MRQYLSKEVTKYREVYLKACAWYRLFRRGWKNIFLIKVLYYKLPENLQGS